MTHVGVTADGRRIWLRPEARVSIKAQKFDPENTARQLRVLLQEARPRDLEILLAECRGIPDECLDAPYWREPNMKLREALLRAEAKMERWECAVLLLEQLLAQARLSPEAAFSPAPVKEGP